MPSLYLFNREQLLGQSLQVLDSMALFQLMMALFQGVLIYKYEEVGAKNTYLILILFIYITNSPTHC